ncbi:hypothetical protein K0B04_04260 [Patescibacteria group bacterium]|nr:hypothetical protein [Patescibacteria group bacterium]
MLKSKYAYVSYALFVIIIAGLIARGMLPKGMSEDLDEAVVSEVEDLLPRGEEGSPRTFRGSCSLIDRASTCVEYFGWYWDEQTIQLVCTEGVYSEGRCPEPNLGGCRMMPGSQTDQILWYYDIGADPFEPEEIKHSIDACNSVMGGIWVEED